MDETLSLRRVRVYISSLIKTVQVTALSLSFFTRVRIKLDFFRKRVWFSLLFASMGSLLPLAQNADALDDFSLLCLLLCLLFSARCNEIGRRYERLLREGRLVAEV